MKKILLLAALLLPFSIYAGDQSDYQAGIAFTKDPTGGQAANGNQPAEQR